MNGNYMKPNVNRLLFSKCVFLNQESYIPHLRNKSDSLPITMFFSFQVIHVTRLFARLPYLTSFIHPFVP